MDSKDFTSGSGDGNGRKTTAESPVMVVTTELKAGTLSLPEVLMQNVAVIAPAIASLFYTPVVVGLAGLTSPLAYPIAFVITLMLGMVLVQFTKKMPAAGGYYTYISRSLHPRLGWLVAWLFILTRPRSVVLWRYTWATSCSKNCSRTWASIGPGSWRLL